MDRVEFIHSIGYTEGTDSVNLLMSFFNQYMLLYNLIDDIDKISYIRSFNKSIEFFVDYKTATAAKRNINQIASQGIVNIYNSTCFVNVSPVSEKSVNIHLSIQ